MASDRQQFQRAQARWEALHEAGAYSVPDSLGATAILVSYLPNYSPGESEIRGFTQEAYALADSERNRGREVEVILDADGDDMTAVLREPSISRVVTIGHGALSYFNIANDPDPAKRESIRYSWRDVSKNADHLKTGLFVQRHCGHAAEQLSVPLGSFAMKMQCNVIASVNKFFMPNKQPRTIIDSDSLRMVSTERRFTYKQIKQLFPYDSKPSTDQST